MTISVNTDALVRVKRRSEIERHAIQQDVGPREKAVSAKVMGKN